MREQFNRLFKYDRNRNDNNNMIFFWRRIVSRPGRLIRIKTVPSDVYKDEQYTPVLTILVLAYIPLYILPD